MVKSTIKDYFSSTQCDRIVCQNRDGINVLPFNQLTDEELASDLNNEKMDTNNNVQDKKSETMDTDFLNNYNMDDNIDEKYDHTFFSEMDPNINVSNTNESLYFNEDDINKNFNNSKNLYFIHINICSVPKNLNKFELFLSNLKHEFPIICCSESWLKNSTKDRYTPKGFTHVFDYREKREEGELRFLLTIQYNMKKEKI